MPKRFKFRISPVFPTFLSCRSKDPSSLPSNPTPAFHLFSTVNHKFANSSATPPPPTSVKPHLTVSVGCGGLRSRHSETSSSFAAHRNESTSDFKWRKDEKWHVIAKIHDEAPPRRKIYNSAASGVSDDDDDDVAIPPLPPPFLTEMQKRRSGRKKKLRIRLRLSTSSADSGLFSSEGREEKETEGEETETLVSSSRSFSTDSSSEYNPHLETIREGTGIRCNKKNAKNKKLKKRCVARKRSSVSSEWESDSATPARLSVFQRLIPCTVEGKVRESFAVVKKSEDPYEDFRRSMMEMILEKQMFEERDLEQMLHCFLSLNSRYHHQVILEAFTEIWEALFCNSPGGSGCGDTRRNSTSSDLLVR